MYNSLVGGKGRERAEILLREMKGGAKCKRVERVEERC